jgi:hypothetical protein
MVIRRLAIISCYVDLEILISGVMLRVFDISSKKYLLKKLQGGMPAPISATDLGAEVFVSDTVRPAPVSSEEPDIVRREEVDFAVPIVERQRS